MQVGRQKPIIYTTEYFYLQVIQEEDVTDMSFYFELVNGLTIIQFVLTLLTAQWPCLVSSDLYPRNLCRVFHLLVLFSGIGLIAALALNRFSHEGRVCAGDYLVEEFGEEYEESKGF